MSKKDIFLVMISGVISIQGFSQSVRYKVSMPYLNLTAYSLTQHDVFSFTGNQAALAQEKNMAIGIYSEQRFLLADDRCYEMAAVFPAGKDYFGIMINYSGFANYHEQLAGLAYGRSLGKKIDVGIQFNYYSYSIPTYRNAGTINFEAGIIIHLTEKLLAGVHVYNPVHSKSNGKDEKLTSVFESGLGYDASDNFSVSIEIVKTAGIPVNATGGIQYRFEKQFFIRTGFVSESGSVFAGIGIAKKNLRLDISGNYHPQLGLSPGLLLIANLNSKRQ